MLEGWRSDEAACPSYPPTNCWRALRKVSDGHCWTATPKSNWTPYVLLVCAYATRYPEAIPMKTIDVEQVAEELVKLFSRVGIPKEILTDQGSNFTSQLLAEIYRLLHVHPIWITPHHRKLMGWWSVSTRLSSCS